MFTPHSYFQVGGNHATMTFFLERNTAITVQELTGHPDGECGPGRSSRADQETAVHTAEQQNAACVRAWAALQEQQEGAFGRQLRGGLRRRLTGRRAEQKAERRAERKAEQRSVDSGLSRSSLLSAVCSLQ